MLRLRPPPAARDFHHRPQQGRREGRVPAPPVQLMPGQEAEGVPHQLEKKRVWEAAKSRPCADCGRSFASECMDFDHVRGTKCYTIGSAYRWASMENLVEEIAKCDVVCACCHRTRTKNRPEQNPGRPVLFLAEEERTSARSRPADVAIKVRRRVAA